MLFSFASMCTLVTSPLSKDPEYPEVGFLTPVSSQERLSILACGAWAQVNIEVLVLQSSGLVRVQPVDISGIERVELCKSLSESLGNQMMRLQSCIVFFAPSFASRGTGRGLSEL